MVVVQQNDRVPISVQGTVGPSAFVLEIPASAVRKAGALLGLTQDGEGPALERRLRDVLSAEAFRVAMGGYGDSDEAWRTGGFSWDQPQECWHRIYPWTALLHMLFPGPLPSRIQNGEL
jgi:hypothetical protein